MGARPPRSRLEPRSGPFSCGRDVRTWRCVRWPQARLCGVQHNLLSYVKCCERVRVCWLARLGVRGPCSCASRRPGRRCRIDLRSVHSVLVGDTSSMQCGRSFRASLAAARRRRRRQQLLTNEMRLPRVGVPLLKRVCLVRRTGRVRRVPRVEALCHYTGIFFYAFRPTHSSSVNPPCGVGGAYEAGCV